MGWGYPYQDAGHWMGWWMPFHGVLSLIILVLLIVGITAFVRFLWSGGSPGSQRRGLSTGLDVLDERYGKGEINREEYLQKKRDLGG